MKDIAATNGSTSSGFVLMDRIVVSSRFCPCSLVGALDSCKKQTKRIGLMEPSLQLSNNPGFYNPSPGQVILPQRKERKRSYPLSPS
ncbi:unnamed protein product [Dovyalis caffra]|uniref:Uncharacterized protein n=1 Tax=Dovyalis caffra TaxID=77055 RepID=A0AAV1RLY7_9ROSI|nr:unnamed protein product [Dovyalis caffra]